MKKIFSILTAVLFAGSMFAGEVTLNVSMEDYAKDNNCVISAGNNATPYTTLNLNDDITVSTSGEPNCGSFWGATNTEWRLYQAKKGDITIAAGEGCTIKTVTITFKTNNNTDILKDGEVQTVESGEEYPVNAQNITFTVGNSDNKTNGQIKISNIKVIYESDKVVVSAPVFEPAESDFVEELEVTLTCATQGAVIYYIFDNEDFGMDAKMYTEPLKITETTTIKAKALLEVEENNIQESAVTTKEYTKAEVLSVAEALAALSDETKNVYNVFVKGIISKLGDFETPYYTYYISDDGQPNNELMVYKGLDLDGVDFVTDMALQVGKKVIIKGNLKYYTPQQGDPVKEFAQGSKIVKMEDTSTAIDNTLVSEKAVKSFENGRMIIIKNGVKYDALGQIIK